MPLAKKNSAERTAVRTELTVVRSTQAYTTLRRLQTDELVARVQKIPGKDGNRTNGEKKNGKFNNSNLSNVYRLPPWPDTMRGMPNGLLRSALFGAIRTGRRRYMKREEVAALQGVTILYTGERLDQNDLDVWVSVLHCLRHQPLGEPCRITAYALLKLMGKTDTGKNRRTLHEKICRLRASALEFQKDRYLYIGGLIDEAYKDNKTEEWVIVVNNNLHILFGYDQFTQVDWTVRRALGRKQLAQWLHGFYASHANPYPMRMDTLLTLAGSEDANASSKQQTLRKALDALVAAGKAHGWPFKYEIRGNLVHTQKKPSGAQKRHLAKKAGAQRRRSS